MQALLRGRTNVLSLGQVQYRSYDIVSALTCQDVFLFSLLLHHCFFLSVLTLDALSILQQ